MVRIILVCLFFNLTCIAQTQKIVKILGSNYFELDNGKKVSLIDVSAQDNNKNIRWCTYNLLNKNYIVNYHEMNEDTVFVKIFLPIETNLIDVSELFMLNDIGLLKNKQLTNKYDKISIANSTDLLKVKNNFIRPNLKMLPLGILHGLLSVGSFSIAALNNNNNNGSTFFISLGIIEAIVSYFTIDYALIKQYQYFSSNEIGIKVPIK